jgi:nitroreductase
MPDQAVQNPGFREGEKAVQAILTRRSIRRYTGQEVSREILLDLLRAAMSAPSAGNEQPWEFVVIMDRRLLDAIPGFHPYAHMLTEAPAAILVCGDLSREKYKGYWVQDCADFLVFLKTAYRFPWLPLATLQRKKNLPTGSTPKEFIMTVGRIA